MSGRSAGALPLEHDLDADGIPEIPLTEPDARPGIVQQGPVARWSLTSRPSATSFGTFPRRLGLLDRVRDLPHERCATEEVYRVDLATREVTALTSREGSKQTFRFQSGRRRPPCWPTSTPTRNSASPAPCRSADATSRPRWRPINPDPGAVATDQP